jgi:hypothetical protein
VDQSNLRRRAIDELMALDDRTLADIGLSRAGNTKAKTAKLRDDSRPRARDSVWLNDALIL